MSRALVFIALCAVAAEANMAIADMDAWSDTMEDVEFDLADDIERSMLAGSNTHGSSMGPTPAPPTPAPPAPTPAPTVEGAPKPVAIPNTMTGFTKATFTYAYQLAFRKATKLNLNIVGLKLSQITIGPVADVSRRRLVASASSSIKFDTIITLTKAVADAAPTLRDDIKDKSTAMANDPTSLIGIFKDQQEAASLTVITPTIVSKAPIDYTPPTPAGKEKKFPVAAVIVPVVLLIGLGVMKKKNMWLFSKGEKLNNPTSQEGSALKDQEDGSAVAHQNAL